MAFSALCVFAARPAGAEPSATVTVERHFTSNAFDSVTALPDWYTLLRGALGHTFQQENGNVRVGAEFQATRHDTHAIENDAAVALTLDVHRTLGERFEIRGTLSYSAIEDGDDFEFGPLLIGTRTLKNIFGGRLQLGADLGNATALVLEIAEAFEKAGDTLTSLNLVSVEEIGFPPSAISFAELTVKAEAKHVAADGTTVGLALGAQLLRAADGIFTGVRPTYQALFLRPLPKGFELRGSVAAAFDTIDSDDPLCSWLQRGELEMRFRPTEKLVLGSGVFAEVKENLLFENRELSRGIYGELAYEATKSVALVFRADYSTTFATVVETRKRTADVFVGIRTKI